MFVTLTILCLVSLLQMCLIVELLKRLNYTQRTISYIEHAQGKNFNYLARLIEVTRD